MQEQKSKKRMDLSGQLAHFLQNQDIQKLSKDACLHLSTIQWKPHAIIAVYYPLNSEINLLSYIKQRTQYSFVAPATDKTFKHFDPSTSFVKKGNFYEPSSKNICPVQDIDVFLVPCVGVDRQGCRLGRGQGYYDQILEQARPETITLAVAFNVQAPSKEFLPMEPHDQKVDGILTPQWLLYLDSFFEKYKLHIRFKNNLGV